MRSSLAATLAAAAVPYGVTIVVSSEILLLRHYRGLPGVGEIFGFAFGAIAGYVLLAAAARPALAVPGSGGRAMVLTGALHVVSIGAALGAGTGLAQLGSWAAWPLVSFAAIPIYLGLVAVQHAVVVQTTTTGT